MPTTTQGSAKPGDFNFLTGEWRIKNRRLKPGTNQWDEFDGEATVWGFLNGLGSLEELRIPAREFAGMGLRGIWDQITPQSCRWYQSLSKDNGKTWEDNWIMHWQRVKT